MFLPRLNACWTVSEDPGPENPALVHPRGLMQVATFVISVQVSGVRCQRLKSIHRIEVDHDVDFHSALETFIHNPIRGRTQESFLLTPET